MNSPPALRHDVSVCFDSAGVPRAPFTPPGWRAGALARPLRRFEDGGGVRSAIITLPAGWSSGGAAACSTTQQLYVLQGEVALGGEVLNERAFAVRAGGTAFAALASPSGAEVLMIFDAPPAFTAADSGAVATVLHRDVLEVPAPVPVVNGVAVTGLRRRTLWVDPASGADTRHLTVGAFEGKGPNWHPVHEEIFCLDGKIGPDDRRILTAGWFLHNPAFGVHGYHEHSAAGAVLLEWHDGPWQLNYV
ncbi:MAG: hypothetical protein SFV21_08040 [Rhodospirillaceae bacterium]|nr:hypothetical protein [Rhodospirillaceae bacterium]